MRGRLHNILLLLATTTLLLLLTEGAASLWLRSRGDTTRRAELITMRSSSTQEGDVPGAAGTAERWESQLVLHPLFGYVYNPALGRANNFGFLSRHDFGMDGGGYFLEDVARSRALVVGVFGGSFAQLMTEQTQGYFEDRLRLAFPDREPVVVNLSIGGHALPQSLFIFTYFRSMLDAAVFVDGFNELTNYVGNNRFGLPPEYAKAGHWDYMLSLGALTPERFARTARTLSLRRRIVTASQISLWPGIRHSIAVHLVWRALTSKWEAEIALEVKAIHESFAGRPQFLDIPDLSLLAIGTRQWGRHHELIHRIAESEGIRDLHVLQPNLHVPDAKQLTAREQAIKAADPELDIAAAAGYPLLRREMATLEKTGAVACDLSLLYVDRTDDVWIDQAHSNLSGYVPVVDRIVELLRKNPPERIRPPAGSLRRDDPPARTTEH
jgi:hypothetical protein